MKDRIKAILNGFTTKTAGRLRLVHAEEGEWDGSRFVSLEFDVACRERLDHYGNDGDGWDEDGWDDNYAGPLYSEIVARLKSNGIEAGWRGPVRVEVGEKGFVNIDLDI